MPKVTSGRQVGGREPDWAARVLNIVIQTNGYPRSTLQTSHDTGKCLIACPLKLSVGRITGSQALPFYHDAA